MKLKPWEIQDKMLTQRGKNELFACKTKPRPNNPALAEPFNHEYEAARAMHTARTRAKLTQAEIAAKMGTTQSAVSRMEKGRVTYTTLCRYVEACGCKLKLTPVF